MAEEKKDGAAKAPAKKTTSAKAPATASAEKKTPATKKAPGAAKAPAKAATAKAPAGEKKASTENKQAPAAKASAKGASVTPADKPAGAEKKAPAAKAPAKKAASTDVERPQVLKVHHLRPAAGSKKERTRVGRGEGSKGKTAGRGTKGTKARYQVRPGFEGGNLNSVMRAPKLRGFKNPFRVVYQVVNLSALAELYPKGGDVTVAC